MDNPKIKPALIGGIVFGVIAALPYISVLNMLCCALYIGAGVLATYLYLREQPPSATRPYGDGALVGLLAGVFCGIAGALASALLGALGVGEEQAAQARAQLDASGIELPAWLDGMMPWAPITPSQLAFQLALNVIMAAIFATIGGLVGVAIFHQRDETAED